MLRDIRAESSTLKYLMNLNGMFKRTFAPTF